MIAVCCTECIRTEGPDANGYVRYFDGQGRHVDTRRVSTFEHVPPGEVRANRHERRRRAAIARRA